MIIECGMSIGSAAYSENEFKPGLLNLSAMICAQPHLIYGEWVNEVHTIKHEFARCEFVGVTVYVNKTIAQLYREYYDAREDLPAG